MKAIAGYLVGAVALALVGAVCLAAGMLDEDIATAQQSLVGLDYEAPEATFEKAERYFEYGSRLPWVGDGPLNDVRARRAALRYWQGRYETLVPQQADPLGSVPQDNIALQLVVANAVYRTGQPQARDRQTTLQVLDAGIQAYLTVLRNAPQQEDAAYNYEYLVRLRDDILKGRRKPGLPGEPDSPHGRAGAPPAQDKEMKEFKVYVPLDSDERENAGEAGKDAPLKRKG